MGLEKDNFAIYDRRDQRVIGTCRMRTPISLGVIFDTSSSMYGKIERSRQAVIQFLRSANPDDEFFLIGLLIVPNFWWTSPIPSTTFRMRSERIT